MRRPRKPISQKSAVFTFAFYPLITGTYLYIQWGVGGENMT